MILGGRAGLASWVLLGGEQREKEERHQIISLATIHFFCAALAPRVELQRTAWLLIGKSV